MERRTFSVSESATMIGVAPNSLRASMRRGEIRHIQIGRRMVIPRSELERLLGEKLEQKGTGAA